MFQYLMIPSQPHRTHLPVQALQMQKKIIYDALQGSSRTSTDHYVPYECYMRNILFKRKVRNVPVGFSKSSDPITHQFGPNKRAFQLMIKSRRYVSSEIAPKTREIHYLKPVRAPPKSELAVSSPRVRERLLEKRGTFRGKVSFQLRGKRTRRKQMPLRARFFSL